MEYEIKIIKYIENPNYETEYKEWQDKQRYSSFSPNDAPRKFIEIKYLKTRITEEEFKLLRDQCLSKY